MKKPSIPQPKPGTRVGVLWYRADQWQRLRELAVDRDQIAETHIEWFIQVQGTLQNLKAIGLIVESIDVDVDDLAQWCKAQGLPFDTKARSQFAAEKLKKMSENQK